MLLCSNNWCSYPQSQVSPTLIKSCHAKTVLYWFLTEAMTISQFFAGLGVCSRTRRQSFVGFQPRSQEIPISSCLYTVVPTRWQAYGGFTLKSKMIILILPCAEATRWQFYAGLGMSPRQEDKLMFAFVLTSQLDNNPKLTIHWDPTRWQLYSLNYCHTEIALHWCHNKLKILRCLCSEITTRWQSYVYLELKPRHDDNFTLDLDWEHFEKIILWLNLFRFGSR